MRKKYIIRTDGGSRGNPGPSGCGAAIFSISNEVLATDKKYLGINTNNQAEYQGVLLGFSLASKFFGKKKTMGLEFCFELDSELVVRQLNREYQVKEEKLWPLFMAIWNLRIKDFPFTSFAHIPRLENKLADKLVNEVLDQYL